MATPDELLQKLEERFILGEISEETYKELKARLLARTGRGQAATGSTNVSDSVIKGDVSSTTGAASVGSIHVNLPGGPPAAHAPRLVVCPLCGRRNKPESTFRCRNCKQDDLCIDHFVAEARMCDECVAKDEGARRKLEVERARREAEERAAAAPAPTLCEWDALEMLLVPEGEFRMGSNEDDSEKPVHTVRLSACYMAKCPVTNAQYGEFIRDAGHRQPESWDDGRFNNPVQPVVGLDWNDAVAFCRWLSRTTGQPYRLPTEAEWERAARGTDGRTYPWGDRQPDSTLCDFGQDYSTGRPAAVGSFPLGASPCGCLDMAGGVWEWCHDWYGAYAGGSQVDPKGPASGENRVVRGGSWDHGAINCRCANRAYDGPDDGGYSLGFRVARPLP